MPGHLPWLHPIRLSPRGAAFLPQAVLRPDLPVGGRLLHFSEAWTHITSDPWVLNIVREGYVIPFLRNPPLSSTPIDLSSNHPLIPEALTKLLEKGAVERVSNPDSPGFYSRLFLVPKKNGAWRPIIDLSTLNSFIDVQSFKMETTSSIRASIQPGDWAVSLDLTDAYFHVPIHPKSRKYLRFCAGNEVFQFRVLPFGISTAPRVFTKLMVTVAAHLRLKGSILLQYFDDWLLHQADRERLLKDLASSWSEIASLGLLLNDEKSDLVPAQDFTFVGMNFLTSCNRVRVPPPRVEALITLVRHVQAQTQIQARSFLSLIGVLNAAAEYVQLGRLHLRPIQIYLHSLWKPGRDSLAAWVPILPSLQPLLQWWLDEDQFRTGVPLVPPTPSLFLITDASLSGWGAHLEPLGLMTSGSWSPMESQLHINNLELRAVRLAITHFRDQIRNCCVLVSTDNTTVVSYILKQGGTHSTSLFRESLLLFEDCQALDVTVLAKHLPGRLNVLADGLSRRQQILPSEWTLQQEVANQIFWELGQPMVDLFATRHNHRLPLYVSPVLDPAAWAVDALSLDWNLLVAYAFPPFILIPQVLRKIRNAECHVLLVAPLWPQRSWFSDLLYLLWDYPRALPRRTDLLFQRNQVLHSTPDMFQLHVWPLSGLPSERNAFRLGLPPSSPRLEETPPLQSTTLSGGSLPIGVVLDKLIHSVPLCDE